MLRMHAQLFLYAHFKRSSAACGFTEEEILLRLQRALRAPALEAVEDLLLLSNNLEETLGVLETKFGRRELMVDSMIEKVRKIPAVRIAVASERLCLMCRGSCRSLGECFRFLGLTSTDRRAFVKRQELCRKCLKF